MSIKKKVTQKKSFMLLLIDESGSMGSIQNETIQTYQSIVEKIYDNRQEFKDLEQYICLWTFGSHIKEIIPPTLVSSTNFPEFSYHPMGFTPLYDAIGIATKELEAFIHQHAHAGEYLVNVNIITDGLENSSKEYTAFDIKKIVERLETRNWVFQYFGADHDVEKVSHQLSIKNKQRFYKTAESMNHVACYSNYTTSYNIKKWLHESDDDFTDLYDRTDTVSLHQKQ